MQALFIERFSFLTRWISLTRVWIYNYSTSCSILPGNLFYRNWCVMVLLIGIFFSRFFYLLLTHQNNLIDLNIVILLGRKLIVLKVNLKLLRSKLYLSIHFINNFFFRFLKIYWRNLKCSGIFLHIHLLGLCKAKIQNFQFSVH